MERWGWEGMQRGRGRMLQRENGEERERDMLGFERGCCSPDTPGFLRSPDNRSGPLAAADRRRGR